MDAKDFIYKNEDEFKCVHNGWTTEELIAMMEEYANHVAEKKCIEQKEIILHDYDLYTDRAAIKGAKLATEK